jgi:hypothetical protein
VTDRVIDAARRQAAERQREADKARFRIAALPAEDRDRLHFEIARELHTHSAVYKTSPAEAIKAARELLNAWDAAEATTVRQWAARKAQP